MIILKKNSEELRWFIFGMKYHAFLRFMRKYGVREITRAEFKTLKSNIRIK